MSDSATGLVAFPLSFSKKTADGVAVSPEHISRSDFLKFYEQASKFVYGSDANAPHSLPAMEKGSLRLVFSLPAVIASALTADIAAINDGNEDAVSMQERLDVAREWERAALKDDSVLYSIGATESNLRISKATPLKLPPERAAWIRVERFVTGTVENVGGKQKANLHVTVPGEKNLLVIESSKDMLRGFDKVYSEVTLKVSYEYHHRTLEKKNFHLEKIISAKPAYSREERMERVKKIAGEGRKIWADVPDHNAWLRDLRGENG